MVAEDQSQSRSRRRRMRERRVAVRQAQLISFEIWKSFEQVALRADADEFIPSLPFAEARGYHGYGDWTSQMAMRGSAELFDGSGHQCW